MKWGGKGKGKRGKQSWLQNREEKEMMKPVLTSREKSVGESGSVRLIEIKDAV